VKLLRLFLKNYKCIPELEIRPKAVTIMSGKNGLGKTTVLDAIALIFDGGHQPHAIRLGAKRAEITLEIEESPGNCFTVCKTINQKSSSLVVTKPDGEPAESPQAWLKELASGISFDPVMFAEDPKARAEWIQRVMPMVFTVEQSTRTIYGDNVAAILKKHITGPVDLEGLLAVRQKLYDERREQNGRTKQLDGTLKTLKASLPAESENKDWAAEIAAAQSELDELAGSKLNTLREIDAREKDNVRGVTDEFQVQIDKLIAERDAKIQSIQMEARSERLVANDASSSLEQVQRERRTRAQERATDATRVATLRGEYERAKQEHAKAESAALNLDEAIETLDELRKQRTKEMPIEGAEVRDGQLFINDRHFDVLSTSEKLKVAFQFAGQLPNKLPMMISDRAESFDEANWQEVKTAAAESGWQVFFSRVTQGEELAVETI